MSESVETSDSNDAGAENKFALVVRTELNVDKYNQSLFQLMYNRSELSDVTLSCDEQTIRAHRIVLAAHSPYFDKQFEEKPSTGLIIPIDNVKFNILESAVKLMYFGSTSIEPQIKPALTQLLNYFGVSFQWSTNEAQSIVTNGNVNKKVDVVVDNDKKTANTSDAKDNKKEPRTESHDNENRMSEYDQFVSSVDEIIRTLTSDNFEAKFAQLLEHKVSTERLVTIANLILRQVISIACETPTICYVKLCAAINAQLRSDSFTSILFSICLKFFVASIQRKLTRPDSADASTMNALDQQIHALQLTEYHFFHERLRRIVRFISQLYTQKLILGGHLLVMQEKELQNLDRGIYEFFFVLLTIFDVAGKMLSEEHPAYMRECVAKLKNHLSAIQNKPVSTDAKTLIAQAIEMSESGWKRVRNIDGRCDRDSANESFPKSAVEEHLYWIKNTMAREPARLTYHLARNNGERNKESRRRGKQGANKPADRNKSKKASENESNVPREPAAPRPANQQAQVPPITLKRTNNQQTAATSSPPSSGPNADKTTPKSSRTRKRDRERIRKFIAEKNGK